MRKAYTVTYQWGGFGRPSHKGVEMSDDELLSLIESYLEDNDLSDLMRVVADALESVGH